jgi:predicted amidophosphoribosyltransferase
MNGYGLPMKCPKCGEDNPPGANFCGHCSNPFSNRGPIQPTSEPQTQIPQPLPTNYVRHRPPPRELSPHQRKINKLAIVGFIVGVLAVALLLLYS